MPQKEHVRFVCLGTLRLRTEECPRAGTEAAEIPLQSTGLSLKKVLELWASPDVQETARKEGVIWRNGRALSLSSARIEQDGAFAVLLFDATDPNGADVAYRNSETKALRVNRKKPGEGVDYSAHMTVRLDSRNGICAAALEEAPFLAAGAVNSILQKVANTICHRKSDELRRPSPTGEPAETGAVRMEPFRFRLTFQPTPSGRLLDAIRDRKALLSLEMVNDAPENDEFAPFKIHRTSYALKRPDAGFFESLRNGFGSLADFARRRGCGHVKARLRVNGSRTRTVWLAVGDADDDSDEWNKSFVEMKEIEGLKNRLATGTDAICDELADKMKGLLS